MKLFRVTILNQRNGGRDCDDSGSAMSRFVDGYRTCMLHVTCSRAIKVHVTRRRCWISSAAPSIYMKLHPDFYLADGRVIYVVDGRGCFEYELTVKRDKRRRWCVSIDIYACELAVRYLILC